MATYRKTIISPLLVLCLFIAVTKSQNGDSSFRGGHFSWRPSSKANVIEIDYRVFFDLSGNEARRCTEDAIKRKETIRTGYGIYVWDDNPYLSTKEPRQIGRINFVCKLHDKDFMKRIVGEFEGYQYKAHRFKFYIGVQDSVINKPIFTYVDLTQRNDTNKINQSPRVTIFPYYQVDRGDSKISIHAVDEDDDYIKCTDMASKKVINDCDMTIPSFLPNGYYQGWVLVEDFSNKDSKKAYSQVIVQFGVQKMKARLSSLRPQLSIPQSRSCLFLKNFNGEWKSNVFAFLSGNELKAMTPQFLGPSGATTSISSIGKNRTRINLRWQPEKKTQRKHVFCFVFAGVERKEPSKIHVSEVKCWYLNYGKKTLKFDILYPRNGSVVSPLVDRFEIKVYGALNKSPSWSRSYLAVRNQKDNKLEYFFHVHKSGSYTRTPDNRIILTSNRIKFLKPGNYYVTTNRALYNPQSKCMQSGIITKNDWMFSVIKESSKTTIATTRSTATSKETPIGTSKTTTPTKTTVLSTEDSHVYTKLSKGNLINVIPLWSRAWRVSFSIKPDPTASEYQNIFHFTTGEFCCRRGTRIPVVFQVPGQNKLTIMTSINDNNNYRYDTDKLPANKFSQITIEQIENPQTTGSYNYHILVNGKQVHSVENNAAQDFRNVKVYAGNPWYEAADVKIKDFEYKSLDTPNDSLDLLKPVSSTPTTTRKASTTTSSTVSTTSTIATASSKSVETSDSSRYTNLYRGNLITTIPSWTRSWRVSFSIKPFRTATDYMNVFQFTTGKICCDKGNRIPAIYQTPYEDKLSIISAVNSENNYRFETGVLPDNTFTRIIIEQIRNRRTRNSFTYRILVDDRLINSVENNAAEEYKNVKVYGGNPWQTTAYVYVKDFTYETLEKPSDIKTSATRRTSSPKTTTTATTATTTRQTRRQTSTSTTNKRKFDFNRFSFDNGRPSAALTKIQHNSVLECYENKMEFFFQAGRDMGEIEKVTLSYDWCKMKFSRTRNGYVITTSYDQCGTMMKESSDYILFKNVARVYYLDKANQHSLITRSSVFNIGLECQMNKKNIHTMKAKSENSDGLVTNPQTVQYHDYAKGYGSFRVDFQVYKSASYNQSYGTEEFPIYLGVTDRIFFELSMNREDLNVIPHSCYATVNSDHRALTRYYLIEDRCPKDVTYKQHSKNYGDVFKFSIQAFNMKEGGDSFYVHCHSYVCKNLKDERCQFGCNNRRAKRDIELKKTITKDDEGIMTSTLEIRIKDDNINKVEIIETSNNDENKPAKKPFTKYIYYLQIPIVLIIAGAIYLAWKCLRRNNLQEESKQ